MRFNTPFATAARRERPHTGVWYVQTAVAPNTGFDASGDPIGADEGGLWQIRVELFDATGNQVDPEAIGIAWRVPASSDLTGTLSTVNAASLGLVAAAAV